MSSFPERRQRIIKAAQLKQEAAHGTASLAVPAASPTPAHSSPPGAETPSAHVLRVARQVARATLAAAQRDAQEIREAVARETHRAAFVEGRAAGYAAGMETAQADSQRILQEAGREAQEVLRRAESQVGQLACEIAAHLLGVELRLNPEIVERAVLAIVQDMEPGGPISIEVSPADYQSALQSVPTFRAALGSGTEDLRVVEDRRLPQGGIRVSGPNGTVERNWQEGLLAISEAFEEVARRGL